MFRIISKLKNRKGFTLIELIVVLAVLAIIMAIAVPRFMGIQDESRINADVAAAEQMIKAARLQEAKNNNGLKITKTASPGVSSAWDNNIMEWPQPQSGTGDFTLSGGADDEYEVTWTVTKGSIAKGIAQTVTEGEEFELDVTP